MRKKFIVFVTLVLLLMLSAGSAWAAYCTACGVSISDSAHLCPRCGARQMPSTAALAITHIRSNGDGTVTVHWSGGAGPCTISCVQKMSSDIAADLADSACLGYQPASSGVFDGHSGTADLLVPGQEYWIVVHDAKGRLAYRAWNPGRAPVFPDFPISVTLQLHSSPGAGYSADVLLTYPALTHERTFTARVCITAPTGAVLTDTVTDLRLPAGSDSLYLAACDLSSYFSRLQECCGSIPVGEYTWSLYFGGMYAGSQTFRVTD